MQTATNIRKVNARRFAHRLELATVLIMGGAGVATAWSGYQAARWSGLQSIRNAEATTAEIQSTEYAIKAGQVRLIDVDMFRRWADAFISKNDRLAAFYKERFGREFAPAFEAWMASRPLDNTDAPPTPFALPQYRLSLDDSVTVREATALRAVREAQNANKNSDAYVMSIVILATVIFFAGVAQQLHFRPLRITLLVFALILFLTALVNVVRQPAL